MYIDFLRLQLAAEEENQTRNAMVTAEICKRRACFNYGFVAHVERMQKYPKFID
jgi:hypothetical protein